NLVEPSRPHRNGQAPERGAQSHRGTELLAGALSLSRHPRSYSQALRCVRARADVLGHRHHPHADHMEAVRDDVDGRATLAARAGQRADHGARALRVACLEAAGMTAARSRDEGSAPPPTKGGSHEAPRVHHAARRRGGVASSGMRAATGDADKVASHLRDRLGSCFWRHKTQIRSTIATFYSVQRSEIRSSSYGKSRSMDVTASMTPTTFISTVCRRRSGMNAVSAFWRVLVWRPSKTRSGIRS